VAQSKALKLLTRLELPLAAFGNAAAIFDDFLGLH